MRATVSKVGFGRAKVHLSALHAVLLLLYYCHYICGANVRMYCILVLACYMSRQLNVCGKNAGDEYVGL